MKHPPVTFPGALGRPAHRSAAHQRTFVHEQTVDKARLLMGETACRPSLKSCRQPGGWIGSREWSRNCITGAATRRVCTELNAAGPLSEGVNAMKDESMPSDPLWERCRSLLSFLLEEGIVKKRHFGGVLIGGRGGLHDIVFLFDHHVLLLDGRVGPASFGRHGPISFTIPCSALLAHLVLAKQRV